MTPGPHVLFLDDRQPTRARIAAGLEERGHTVSWLVTNRRFASRRKNVHVAPYPASADLAPAPPQFMRIQQSDPWIRYYGGNANHYRHYHQWITELLRTTQPDLVIGGATQFHELLAVDASRELGIPFIVPRPAPYSADRFVCYCYDTQEIVGGCGHAPKRAEVNDFIRNQAAGARVPADLNATRAEMLQPHGQRNRPLRGGRYCLPHRWKRLRSDRRNRKNLQQWNTACDAFPRPMAQHNKIKILYPLQAQPEPGMDLWGAPYGDQPALLEQLAIAAGDQATIFVKPPPRAGFEMTPSLLAAIRRNHALQPLSSRVRMQDAFTHADLILTVTGTIALQAIFARKPSATLTASLNNTLTGCRYMSTPEKLATLLYELQSGHFLMHGREDVFTFAELLFAESYPGVIDEPFNATQESSVENGTQLVEAFQHLIRQVLASGRLVPVKPAAVVGPAQVERKA